MKESDQLQSGPCVSASLCPESRSFNLKFNGHAHIQRAILGACKRAILNCCEQDLHLDFLHLVGHKVPAFCGPLSSTCKHIGKILFSSTLPRILHAEVCKAVDASVCDVAVAERLKSPHCHIPGMWIC